MFKNISHLDYWVFWQPSKFGVWDKHITCLTLAPALPWGVRRCSLMGNMSMRTVAMGSDLWSFFLLQHPFLPNLRLAFEKTLLRGSKVALYLKQSNIYVFLVVHSSQKPSRLVICLPAVSSMWLKTTMEVFFLWFLSLLHFTDSMPSLILNLAGAYLEGIGFQ